MVQAKSATVTNIPVKSISPNPHNPRRLFDPVPLEILKGSIEKLGVLVPLDVYPKDTSLGSQDDQYVLLDGERRWRCVQELGILEVPCIIIEAPSEQHNILTMFHIHNVREGWQLMPTALKLQELMGLLNTENERELAELTKLTISQVRRCKQLLTYPPKFQNMMLAPVVSDRFKADFFIDLQRIRGPALEKQFPPWIERGDEVCIDLMIDKYQGEIIKAVTEFRLLASIYRACETQNREPEFMEELDRLLSTPDMGIADIEIEGATYARDIVEIGRSTTRLLRQVQRVDLENLSSDEKLIDNLRELARVIDEKLQQALLNVPTEIKDR